MPKESFLLVSLKEDKAKKLAQVVTNDSCRKILDYLAEKSGTETELAEKLDIPISTVHYNLKQLLESGLVISDEYHYSAKGKEVSHYKLANKYIIIAPKTTFGIKEKLKAILPVALIALVATGAVQLYSLLYKTTFGAAETTKTAVIREAAIEAEKVAAPAMEAAPEAAQAITPAVQQNLALWFLYGAIFTLAVYFLVEFIKYRREKQ